MGSAAGTESVGSPPSGSGPNVMPINRSEEAPITEGEKLSKKRKRPSVDDASEPRRTKRQTVRHNYQQMNDPGVEWAYLDKESGHKEEEPTEYETILAAFAENGSFDPNEPRTLREAQATSDWPKWEEAVRTELTQLKNMGTWELVEPQQDRTLVGNRWVLVKKTNKEGEVVKYKARLVAKGYSQIPGMDYNDTFSPVVRLETIRSILSTAAALDWEVQQMDVKGAYLNGILKEDVYMKQPEGYDDGTGRVCRLRKTLYGLKQSGREWNIELNLRLTGIGFRQLESDPCVYIKRTTDGIQIITVWVDDLLLFTDSQRLMDELKGRLTSILDVTDLGEPKKIVGIEIT
jgi:hypothetical protein